MGVAGTDPAFDPFRRTPPDVWMPHTLPAATAPFRDDGWVLGELVDDPAPSNCPGPAPRGASRGRGLTSAEPLGRPGWSIAGVGSAGLSPSSTGSGATSWMVCPGSGPRAGSLARRLGIWPGPFWKRDANGAHQSPVQSDGVHRWGAAQRDDLASADVGQSPRRSQPPGGDPPLRVGILCSAIRRRAASSSPSTGMWFMPPKEFASAARDFCEALRLLCGSGMSQRLALLERSPAHVWHLELIASRLPRRMDRAHHP